MLTYTHANPADASTLPILSAGVRSLVERRGVTFASGSLVLTPQEVGDPMGLLPYLMLDAARIWSEATGARLGIRIYEDSEAGFLLRCGEPRCPAAIALLAVDMSIEEAIAVQGFENAMFEAGEGETASPHRRIIRYGSRLTSWARAVRRSREIRLQADVAAAQGLHVRSSTGES